MIEAAISLSRSNHLDVAKTTHVQKTLRNLKQRYPRLLDFKAIWIPRERGERIMLTRGTLAAMSFVIGASLANAADLIEPAEPVADWTGFYAGIHAGWGWGDADFKTTDSDFTGTVIDDGFSTDVDGPVAGGQIGLNWQINQFLLGIEADASWSSIDGDLRIDDIDPPSDYYFIAQTDVEWLASIRGRAGVVWDAVLLYATGGIAFAGLDVDAKTEYGGEPAYFNDSESETLTGWVLGGGIEAKLAENVTGRIEFLHYEFDDGDFTLNFHPNPEAYFLDLDSELSLNVIRAGVNILF
jgi:outer membrane immunogenic protein